MTKYNTTMVSHVDIATGEIKEKMTISKYGGEKEPLFVKAYLSDLGKLYGLSKSCIPVLFEMIKIMDYQSIVNMHSLNRKKIATAIGGTVKLVDKCLYELIANEIVLRYKYGEEIIRGEFLINPDYFAKGEYKDIKMIKHEIIYKDGQKLFIRTFDRNSSDKKELNPNINFNN